MRRKFVRDVFVTTREIVGLSDRVSPAPPEHYEDPKLGKRAYATRWTLTGTSALVDPKLNVTVIYYTWGCRLYKEVL